MSGSGGEEPLLNSEVRDMDGGNLSKKGKTKQADTELANFAVDQNDDEMTTPLYLVSSILFLNGCLFYTLSAALWYIFPIPTAEQNFIITCVEGLGAISYLFEPLVDFADVLIRANWARKRNPNMKCSEVLCEDPMGLAAAFFFLVASALYFWANVLSLVMIYNRETDPHAERHHRNCSPAPAPTFGFGFDRYETDQDFIGGNVITTTTTTWTGGDSPAPGPAPSPKWERSQTDILNDIAAGIFLFDAAIGLVALWQRRRADKGTENERRIVCCKNWRDCDFSWWGDWFFFFGAIMECMDLSNWYDPAKNMASCCLWTIDAILYMLDYYSWSEVQCCAFKMIPEERRRSSSMSQLTLTIDNLDAPLLGALSPIAEADEDISPKRGDREMGENLIE